MKTTYKHRVEDGIKLFDEKSPGWREKINIDTLDVCTIGSCPLGQVFGSFGKGIAELGLELYNTSPNSGGASDYGFDIYSGEVKSSPDAWLNLTNAWKSALAENKLCRALHS